MNPSPQWVNNSKIGSIRDKKKQQKAALVALKKNQCKSVQSVSSVFPKKMSKANQSQFSKKSA